jgi:hypothetical protein
VTKVSVIVPWRADGGQRDRLWAWCLGFWRSQLDPSAAEILECDSGDERFTRGRSINLGVSRARGDLLVIADADTFVSALPEALRLCDWGGRWTIAYDEWEYHFLTPEATERRLALSPVVGTYEPVEGEWKERLVSRSGCIVFTRAMWETVGGYDPRFYGWGYEDDALVAAADTLLGHHSRAEGWAVQLWHPHIESERFEQPHIGENRALSDRYALARGNPDAMRALIAEAR